MISVIIPVYNAENYLVPLVDSVLAQTYENIEVILINDGSTDRSLRLCEAFARTDSRVIVQSIPNSGSSVARNTGIAIAKGEYIAFADSDDALDPTLLEELLTALRENEVLVSVALGRKVKPDGTPVKTADVITGETKALEGTEKLHFIFDHVAPWAKLYHRSVFSTFRFCEGIVHQDFDLIPKIVFEQPRIAVVVKQLYSYVLREDSITGNNQKKRKPDLFHIIDRSIETYLPQCDDNPDTEYFLAEYLQHGFVRFKRVIAQGERQLQSVYVKAYCDCYRKWQVVILKNPHLSLKEKITMLLGAYSPWLFEQLCKVYLKGRD